MDLGEYLRDGTSKPWTWGMHDCSAWPAIWADIPLPRYASVAEAERMVRKAGGLIRLWERHIKKRAARVAVTDCRAGDIGILSVLDRVAGEYREIGAIFTGQRWAFVPMQGGLVFVSAEPVAAWRPKCRS